MLSLEIKVARFNLFEGKGLTRAYADVILNDSFVVKGFRVIDGKNGIFVGMPGKLDEDGKWYDSAHPVTQETKDALTNSILATYKERQPKG